MTRAPLLVAGTVIAVAALAVYAQVRDFDSISFDDPRYVYKNEPVLKGLTWDGAVWAVTTNHHSNWHPVTWLSHMLDVELFGDRGEAPALRPGGRRQRRDLPGAGGAGLHLLAPGAAAAARRKRPGLLRALPGKGPLACGPRALLPAPVHGWGNAVDRDGDRRRGDPARRVHGTRRGARPAPPRLTRTSATR